MDIRQAKLSDENGVRSCAQAAYQKYVAAIGTKPAPMTANYRAQINSGNVYILSNRNEEVLGFIVFYVSDDAMSLENVAVLPSAKGQGIGRKLIEFCESEARRLGATKVKLYTNEKMRDNLSLFSYLGYHETDRRTQDGFNRVFFEKPIF